MFAVLLYYCCCSQTKAAASSSGLCETFGPLHSHGWLHMIASQQTSPAVHLTHYSGHAYSVLLTAIAFASTRPAWHASMASCIAACICTL